MRAHKIRSIGYDSTNLNIACPSLQPVKNKAAEILECHGLTFANMVQILLTRIALEERLPLGLLTDQADYDVWFKVKVQEVLDDKTPTVSHKEVVGEIQDLISRKRNASS